MCRTRHAEALFDFLELLKSAQGHLIATVPLATGDRYAHAGLVKLARLPFDPPFFAVRQYWHRRGHNDPRVRWLQAQVSQLFNDDTDEWLDIERRLYGRLREQAELDDKTKR